MTSPSLQYAYRVGGSLAWNDPTYVERQADIDLAYALQTGQFCYVLGPQQTGKSSLRVRTGYCLAQRGYRCAMVNATQLSDSPNAIQQWYAGLISSIWYGLNPTDSSVFLNWFKTTAALPPRQRLACFAKDILLTQFPGQPIVIFMDEIDYLLSLPYTANDFFEWIWDCYCLRQAFSAYRRLNFAILGTCTPIDLGRTTPLLSRGRAIKLDSFQLIDTRSLSQGFEDKVDNPTLILKTILKWTNGQPFLTQKLCQTVLRRTAALIGPDQPPLSLSPGIMESWIEGVTRSHIIQDWRRQDDPVHLRVISDRLTGHPLAPQLLSHYQQILVGQPTVFDGSRTQLELLLSGVVLIQHNHLQIANEIYRSVFNINWIRDCFKLAAMDDSLAQTGLKPQTSAEVHEPEDPAAQSILALTVLEKPAFLRLVTWWQSLRRKACCKKLSGA
ncbi:MAG: AAA-like domain-containing protein [Cyanobacteria bacterium P01_A01_bin.114]